ncbi:MAG: phosphoribosylaminoimidazolesuccinocarboxamide synthase [Gemmatimonadales bacterium]|nr:phosphoribosylaminoimidazolesuccinocarboxamide synthase [Gemmatimonadales bacterium]HRX18797.1 phosphoribosylaminoimidazolesuccinocarboxamide synthase [Gemmatimonadales bacterium]
MSHAPAAAPRLPLPLWRQGKVREVYEVDDERLLLVASDRISAFDIVLDAPIPAKGRVLTQLSAFWFRQLAGLTPSHFLTADIDAIVLEVPALAPHAESLAGRSTLVRRTAPVAFECVVRGYLAGSAWAEYARERTLAGERLPEGLLESSPLEPPLFSPATKATSGHDENVPFDAMRRALGPDLADALRDLSLAIYAAGRQHAATVGLIIADSKFEFGLDRAGHPILIDEVLTPDSSRFWPAAGYLPGRGQPSYDKQPVRDWLAAERTAGRWNGEAPAPPVPEAVVAATTARYLEAYRLLTGHDLPGGS